MRYRHPRTQRQDEGPMGVAKGSTFNKRPPGLTFEEAFAWYPREQWGTCQNWLGAKSAGYGQFRYGRVKYYAHHVAYQLTHGEIPRGMQVDHRCRNRSCVNPDHLRLATSKQNSENVGVSAKNTSGYRGVSLHKASGLWTARVPDNGRVHAAYFKTPDEANAWAVAKRCALYTHNEADRMALL